jgi:hypothetical protein
MQSILHHTSKPVSDCSHWGSIVMAGWNTLRIPAHALPYHTLLPCMLPSYLRAVPSGTSHVS